MKLRASLIILLGTLLATAAGAQHPGGPPRVDAAAPSAAAVEGEDTDGDGVPDVHDQCEDTPPGGKVLPDGCMPRNDCRKPRGDEPADDKGCAIEKVYVLRGVTFEFDSDRLTAQGKDTLKTIAEALHTYPELKFELNGHTCWIGSAAYNQGLSQRRARSAARHLVELGIRGDRMKPQGFGESQPIDTNETQAGRELNRRVELRVIE
jgi:OmpA-OmpF porin, OOP family